MQLLFNHIPDKIKLQDRTMDRDLQEEKKGKISDFLLDF